MLTIAVADRLEAHVSRLVATLAEPLGDPFVPDWVAVPSPGMQRWLAHRLARVLGATGPFRRDGVATNIDFPRPGKLRDLVLAAERDPDWVDPWKVAPLTWTMHVLLATRGDELGVPPPASGATTHAVARRIADLFDRYHLHRPDMIRSWADGRDVDGVGDPLAPDKRWQPRLWRAASAHLATPSAPQRLPELLARVSTGDLDLDLPPRLSFFGLTVLPGGSDFIDLVEAVATTRDVQVLLLDPSPSASNKVRAAITASPGNDRRLRAGDAAGREAAHPLVRSWGRSARETAVLLADAEDRLSGSPALFEVDPLDDELATMNPGGAPTRSHTRVHQPTLLSRLQGDIRGDRAPTPGMFPANADRSVQVHGCFGSTRQVEVLRDALLHLLADDVTLREEDIVVLCPRLTEFAPLISGVFGEGVTYPAIPVDSDSPDAPPRLRVRLADRSATAPSPMVAATLALLELASSDFDALAVLELLAHGPVRDRFAMSDRDLELVTEWVTETNIHLGLDATRRARHGIPATFTSNTWQAGIDRLFMGLAVMGDGSEFSIDGLLPADVEGDEGDVLGRVADLLARLAQLSDDVAVARTVSDWASLLRDVIVELIAVDDDNRNAFDSLVSTLTDLGDQMASVGGGVDLVVEFPEIRRAITDALDGHRGRPRFFEGGITFTSLAPLRWVPFRVVAILGLDESAIASAGADGDDLTTATALIGDTDPRSEARAALLEAVLAAGDHLVIVRDGHDVTSNATVTDAVVMAEMREVLRAMVDVDDRDAFEAGLEVDHPRQGSDDRCFTVGALIPDRPWGFDHVAFAGSEARRHRTSVRPPFLAAPLDRASGPIIDLADLADFLGNPSKHFVTRILEVSLPREAANPTAHLPVELSGLEKWGVKARLMDQLVNSREGEIDPSADQVAMATRLERAGGSLPVGSLGRDTIADAAFAAGVVATAAGTYGLGAAFAPSQSVEIDVELGDGTRLRGRIDDVPRTGPAGLARGPVRYNASSRKPKDHLLAWLDLIALVAAEPEGPWHSVVVQAKKSKAKNTPYKDDVLDLSMRATYPATREAAAMAALDTIVDLYRRGLREPLPLFDGLSRKLERAFRTTHDDKPSAWPGPNDWRSSQGFGGAADDEYVALVFDGVSFDEISRQPILRDDPDGEGNTRLLRYATVLWGAYDDTVSEGDPVSTGDPA